MTQASNLTRPGGPTIIGVFNDVSAAERAINDLKVAGFTPDSISIITRDPSANTTTDVVEETEGNEAGKGAVAGALGGGTLGAVLGWLLAGGAAVFIPGIGPVIAAGVLGATVTGALVGGSLGSIASALAGAGIPEEHAKEYEEHVRGGRTIVSAVAANGMLMQSARDIFERNGATNVRSYDDSNDNDGPYTPNGRADITDTAYPVGAVAIPSVPTPPTPMPGGTQYVPDSVMETETNASRPAFVESNNSGYTNGGGNTVITSSEARDNRPGETYPGDTNYETRR